jgi:hypothetical protein
VDLVQDIQVYMHYITHVYMYVYTRITGPPRFGKRIFPSHCKIQSHRQATPSSMTTTQPGSEHAAAHLLPQMMHACQNQQRFPKASSHGLRSAIECARSFLYTLYMYVYTHTHTHVYTYASKDVVNSPRYMKAKTSTTSCMAHLHLYTCA